MHEVVVLGTLKTTLRSERFRIMYVDTFFIPHVYGRSLIPHSVACTRVWTLSDSRLVQHSLTLRSPASQPQHHQHHQAVTHKASRCEYCLCGTVHAFLSKAQVIRLHGAPRKHSVFLVTVLCTPCLASVQDAEHSGGRACSICIRLP